MAHGVKTRRLWPEVFSAQLLNLGLSARNIRGSLTFTFKYCPGVNMLVIGDRRGDLSHRNSSFRMILSVDDFKLI